MQGSGRNPCTWGTDNVSIQQHLGQSGQAQMRHGGGSRQTAPNRLLCDCHVGSDAESAQDSVCPFAAACISDGCFLTVCKMGNCSVDIKVELFGEIEKCFLTKAALTSTTSQGNITNG